MVKQGYTKAVDLWSLGCVTVFLLTGCTPFSKNFADRRATFEAISDAAAKCDLSPIKAMPEWRVASESLQDFVEKLLVLRETARITAEEALLHLWFNDEYKEDWDSVYRFCIKDWKARAPNPSIVETITVHTSTNKVTLRTSITLLKYY